MNQEAIEKAVRMSLEEDIGTGDITTQLILPHKLSRVTIILQENGCGEWPVACRIDRKSLINFDGRTDSA